MKVCLFGAAGKVGAVLGPALTAAGHEVVDGRGGEAGGCDIAVDFTRPDAVVANVDACLAARVPIVIGTTGFDLARVDSAAREAGVPCFFAPNFALGAVLMMRFAEEASRALPRQRSWSCTTRRSWTRLRDGEGDGGAHDWRRADPLGAAARARRAPGGDPRWAGETLTIRHDTTSREAFVPGVLLALDRVRGLPPGLTIGLDALL